MTSVTLRIARQEVLAGWLQLVLDGRRDGRRRPDAAGRAQPRGDHRRADRLLRRRRAAAERAGGRRPGRRVGAVGAQPLRRRRGAARRRSRSGSGSGSPASRCAIDVDAAGRRTRRAARRRSAPRSSRRSHPCAGPRCCRCPTRRRSPRNLARLDRTLRRQLERAFPDARRPTCSTRSTRSRRGTPGTGCAPRRACSVAARPPDPHQHDSCTPRTDRRRTRDERDPTEQGPVHRAHEAPDEGPVVMLNLLKFKARADGRGGERRERVRQVRRSGGADGRGARRQGAVDGPRRPDPHRRRRPRAGTRSRSCSTRAARTSSRWCRRPSTSRRTSTASRAWSARC